jgi:hypothetical protein
VRLLTAGALAALAAGAAADAAKGMVKDRGEAMTNSEGVTMRRLGDATPHLAYRGTSGRDFVDPSPIVLWGSARPAAALRFGVETQGRKAEQTIAPLDPGVKLPGFPVTHEIALPHDATSEDVVDAIDPRALIPADVDGDGVQELVVIFKQGGVSLRGVRGQKADYPSPAGPPRARYKRYLAQPLRLGGRDIVYVLSVCDAPGAERNVLLRVDGKGITRVRPEGLEQAEILALGAIQRPGSEDTDELLIVTADGERDAALGRYRPDGKRLDAPRRMYVAPSRACAFRFVPRSTKAVLEVTGGVLVISPEKPANWIREVKVSGKTNPRDVRYQFTADLESADPKIVYELQDDLWAVNHEGQCFAPAGAGKWTALAKPGPYLHVQAPPGEKVWFVWHAGAEKLFAVSSGERGTRPLTHEEWGEAADRYLPPDEAATFRKRRTPSLDGEDAYRDLSIKEERDERHVDAPVRTVDEWKRLLPRSYAQTLKFRATDHDVDVAQRLRELVDDPKEAAKAPDPSGLRAFLAGIEVPARTTLMRIEGLGASSATVPGSPMRRLETQVRRQVEYALHDGRITAILALEKGDAEGKAPAAFYEIDAPLTARR